MITDGKEIGRKVYIFCIVAVQNEHRTGGL